MTETSSPAHDTHFAAPCKSSVVGRAAREWRHHTVINAPQANTVNPAAVVLSRWSMKA
jgi:hypothetical protein